MEDTLMSLDLADTIRSLSHDQTVDAIIALGHIETVLVEGDMGSGKSTLLAMIGERLRVLKPETPYKLVYIDCTTKLDSGDSFMIKYSDDGKTFHHVPHEELGLHLDGTPCVIMFDEIGKCSRSYQLSARRLMLERKGAGKELHSQTIVFATTNLGRENVGDLLPAHHRDSVTILRLRKANNIEWIEWGRQNDVDGSVLSYVHDHPELMHSFTDYPSKEECPSGIYHPDADQDGFVTPRGLVKCSNWIKVRDQLDDATLRAALTGRVGREVASGLLAYVQLHNDMPTTDEIRANPLTVRVPDSAGVLCMVVYRTLATIERSWATQWMQYLDRLPVELQSLFMNQVNDKDYDSERKAAIHQNSLYMNWCDKNRHLRAPDKV
tara:strand:- start:508 stop:1647 length:1140 start_codon:yes stop_codon:yes gene_type:complete